MSGTVPQTDAERDEASLRHYRAEVWRFGVYHTISMALIGLVILTLLGVIPIPWFHADVAGEQSFPITTFVLIFLAVTAIGFVGWASNQRRRAEATLRLAEFAIDRGFRFDPEPVAEELITPIANLRLVHAGSRHTLTMTVRGRAAGRQLWAMRVLAEYPLASARNNRRTSRQLPAVRETVSVVVVDGLTIPPPAFQLLVRNLLPTAARALRNGDDRVEGFPELESRFTFTSEDPWSLRRWLPPDAVYAFRCEPTFSVEVRGDLLAVFVRTDRHDPPLIERLLQHALWLADLFEKGKRA